LAHFLKIPRLTAEHLLEEIALLAVSGMLVDNPGVAPCHAHGFTDVQFIHSVALDRATLWCMLANVLFS
jgi:hypothetical protein